MLETKCSFAIPFEWLLKGFLTHQHLHIGYLFCWGNVRYSKKNKEILEPSLSQCLGSWVTRYLYSKYTGNMYSKYIYSKYRVNIIQVVGSPKHVLLFWVTYWGERTDDIMWKRHRRDLGGFSWIKWLKAEILQLGMVWTKPWGKWRHSFTGGESLWGSLEMWDLLCSSELWLYVMTKGNLGMDLMLSLEI